MLHLRSLLVEFCFTNIDYHTIATYSITFYTMILTFYTIIKIPKLSRNIPAEAKSSYGKYHRSSLLVIKLLSVRNYQPIVTVYLPSLSSPTVIVRPVSTVCPPFESYQWKPEILPFITSPE